jgi:hypothetical protein
MPEQPRYGFSGRAYELLRLERWLLRGRLVVVHGFGGMGKTALAREAADWWTRTGLFAGACFVPFEQGGSSITLLSALGSFLGLTDAGYDPHNQADAMARLKPILRQRRTLIIADNLESVLPRGEAPLAGEERRQLWDTLLALADAGAGVILTTRDVDFGDGRLAKGRKVAYLELGGLHEEDAYDLASQLLQDLDIDRARAPFAELREFLVQLDHQPLAIDLVLPLLAEVSLARMREDFTALLPRFVDDRATGYNRALLASLEYSLHRLSEEQRAYLPRLAVFRSGASKYEAEGAMAIQDESRDRQSDTGPFQGDRDAREPRDRWGGEGQEQGDSPSFGYKGLAGDSPVVPPRTYRCPVCGWEFMRFSNREIVPQCKNGHGHLDLVTDP